MLNLCSAAGLSIQKIQQLAGTADRSERETYEDHHKATISGGLNEYWTQEEYLVHFRIDPDTLYVSVSDETYSPRIPPSDRSEGFQWYLSFYCRMLNETGTVHQNILLLDNPALELHADGQRDIKKFLEEKMSRISQIIYVTHSPALVDPYNLNQLRKVELHANHDGTKVLNSVVKEGNDFDLLEPVRSAIGASLATSLALNDYNVLVEGAADKPILDASFRLFHKEVSEKILVNGSIAESKGGILPRFYLRAKLPLVIFLDADSQGRELKNALMGYGVPDSNIAMLREIVSVGDGSQDYELEDVLSPDFYHKAVMETYPKNQVVRPDTTGGKRTKSYESLFKTNHKIGFSKKRVGEKVRDLLLNGNGDDHTKENLSKITTAIFQKLGCP